MTRDRDTQTKSLLSLLPYTTTFLDSTVELVIYIMISIHYVNPRLDLV